MVVNIFMLDITSLGRELKSHSVFSLLVWYVQVSFSLIRSLLFLLVCCTGLLIALKNICVFI